MLDGEAEGRSEPGALLAERLGLGEAGGRFEDDEPAAPHLARNRIVPPGGPREDEDGARVPARERLGETLARLRKRAGRAPGRGRERLPHDGPAEGDRRDGAEKDAAGNVHGYSRPEMRRSIAAAVS